MAAPKGNRFWEARSSHGRKPLFSTPDDLWNAAVEYFEWTADNPLEEAIVYQGELNENKAKPLMRAMTLEALWIFLDISDSSWYDYEAKEDFSGVTKQIKQIIRVQKFQGASAGLLNPNIIARDLGLADKSELTGKNGGPIESSVTINFTPVSSDKRD